MASTFAQSNDSEKPGKLGVRAGYHAAWVRFDGVQILGTKALNTFYVGLLKEKKLAPVLRFGAGL